MHNPTQFKLKTSVAAVLFALSSTAAWAGDVNQAGHADATGAIEQTVSDKSAASGADSAKESLGWRFVDGKDTGESAAATSSEDGTNAMSEEEGDQYQAAGPDEQSAEQAAAPEGTGQEPAASTAGEEPGQSAQSPREADGGATAQSGDDDGQEQAATTGDDEGSGQSAMTEKEEGGSDQAANADEGAGSEQADSGDEQAGDQTAGSDQQDSEEQSAQADGTQPPNDPGAQAQVPPQLEGKVIVIIPKDWEGSMEGLLSALQSSPDAKDIVIVQQGKPGDPDDGSDPRAGNAQEPDDTYEASRTAPPVNQQ